jgi:N-acetylmuramoyl-L-alanine amidase
LRGSAVLLFSLPSLAALANAHKSEAWAHGQFAIAERKHEALNGRPVQQQTRRDYQDVIDSYRRVYYGSPTSNKADASVDAVADVMMDMGRRFHDATVLRSAIGQYEFLRREYPGSKYRFKALFAIGEIYEDDLNDGARARKTLEEFVRRYPRNQFAGEARAALAKLAAPVNDDAGSKDSEANSASATDSAANHGQAKINDEERISAARPTSDSAAPQKLAHIISIRHWSDPGHARVVIALDHAVRYQSQRIENPDRIFFDLDAKVSWKLAGEVANVDDDLLKKIRVAQFKSQRARIVLEVGEHSDFTVSLETNPSRLIIDLRDSHIQTSGLKGNDVPAGAILPTEDKQDSLDVGVAKTIPVISPAIPKRIVEAGDDDQSTTAKLSPPISPSPKLAKSLAASSASKRAFAEDHAKRELGVREAQPTASGDRSLIRALGLKIGKIVIDPGHGGYDTGTIGPNSLLEKDLVLDVSRRLGKLLESRLGAQVIYTRKDDTFIPLETRTAIANQEQADLFVSVHANSSHDPAARGVETYYLNFSSSPDALEVAARENAVSETSIHELQDLVKQIALKEKIEESREFASDVQQELHNGLAARNPGLRNRGVKKAPFIVLIGANMPSILAEISFVSNPGDERRLETAAYRQRIAESLYRGISKYVSGLSGVKVASKIDKTSGQ